MSSTVRVDPHLGTKVHIVQGRKNRPNLPSQGCPFCVGGLEAPDPYDVRWIPNRWPALGEGRCEVILYSPDHDGDLGTLGLAGVRRVIDLWAQRSETMHATEGVGYVLVFENRGAEVGATIRHPHGQIYAYDDVPHRPRRRLEAGWKPEVVAQAHDRFVSNAGDWASYVPYAPTYPVEVTLAPRTQVGSLSELSSQSRNELATLLIEVIGRLDALYDERLPYMMWINQAPTNSTATYAQPPWLNIEIVSPWRSKGVSRFIAAAEVAGQEYFHEVNPEELAERLRTNGARI